MNIKFCCRLCDPIPTLNPVTVIAVAAVPTSNPVAVTIPAVILVSVRFALDAVKIPVIIDAGVGTASDASRAMELGVSGILMNTAIAGAKDPLKMALAMKMAVECGRMAYESGRIPKKLYASASSPLDGLVEL